MRAGRVRRRLNFRENEIQIALRDDEFEPNLVQMISLFFLQYSSFSINCLSFLLEFVILKIKFFNICYLKKSHSKNSYLLFSNNNQYSHKHSLHAEASLKSPIIKPSIKRPVSTSCPSLETTFQTTRSIEVVVRMGASKSSLAVKSVD